MSIKFEGINGLLTINRCIPVENPRGVEFFVEGSYSAGTPVKTFDVANEFRAILGDGPAVGDYQQSILRRGRMGFSLSVFPGGRGINPNANIDAAVLAIGAAATALRTDILPANKAKTIKRLLQSAREHGIADPEQLLREAFKIDHQGIPYGIRVEDHLTVLDIIEGKGVNNQANKGR